MSDHLSKADVHLYSLPKAKKQAKKEISSSTTLAFTSQLSSLLATTYNSEGDRSRPRSSANKADIFTSHNRNTKKRAARDLEDDTRSTPTSKLLKPTLPTLDSAELHRSRLKMEEKARKYAAMKRGDYIPTEGEPEQLIDFDRKWAEKEARGGGRAGDAADADDTSSGDDNDNDGPESWDEAEGDPNAIVSYTDEYGRERQGRRAEAQRMERKKRHALLGQEELERMSARPLAPAQVIYGDTVQSAAFNPDLDIEAKMADIAAKRDRSATPPPAQHYEADKEVRNRGTGFFVFSKDEAVRQKEMASLEAERLETERVRRERDARKAERQKEIEKRRREVGVKRANLMADAFLAGLEKEVQDGQDSASSAIEQRDGT